MPIRPENRKRYPKEWSAISRRIRFERALGRCECVGRCGRSHGPDGSRCAKLDGELEGGVRCVLTVAHLDDTPENCEDANLEALCQGCHLRYDRYLHQRNASETRQRKAGQLPLPMDSCWRGRDQGLG